MPDISTNAALAAAGYTTETSPSYGCKRVLKDDAEVGHFDAVTAWTLPGMREVRAQPLTDIERDMGALLGPAAVDVSRKLDSRLDVFDRVCLLAKREGHALTSDEINIARRLILVGATNAEAVLSDVRAAQTAALFEVA